MITVYDQDWAGWSTAVPYRMVEHFDGPGLSPGLWVEATALVAGIGAGGYLGKWYDRVIHAGSSCTTTGQPGPTTTTWIFSSPTFAFGGTWDLGGPGGLGSNIKISVDGVFIAEIPAAYINKFWGFVSTTPFFEVLLEAGTRTSTRETYTLDDLVYSSISGGLDVFVRDREIQAVINHEFYRSPDFGDTWYQSSLFDYVSSVGFDVNNYQNSILGGIDKLLVCDGESNNIYSYSTGDAISGYALDIYCDLNSNVSIIGTDQALYKTLKYGLGGTRVFLNEPVTSVAIGGSYVSNPFFSFAPEELNDAHLYSTDSSYSTARLASNGQLLHDDYAKIGQSKVDSTYSVDRFGLVFDTSLLPDNPIISAMIRLYVIELRADIEFSVYVQGSNDYPSVPIIVGDYNYSLYTGNCGYVNSDSIQEGRYLTINLNSSGLNLINKEGYSRFIIRTNRDINGNEPTGREFIRVNQREKGGHQTPKLFVTIRKEN